MFSRFLISAAVLAPVSAIAAPFDPGFAVDGDAAGNALRFIAWALVLITSGAWLIVLSGFTRDGSRLPREAAQRVRRRRILR